MPFKVIKGTFHVVSYSPDGDSIRFQPDSRALVLALPGARPKMFNPRGHCQLRIEAIDSLETHYSAGGATLNQPKELAYAAAERLMEFLGITDVVWDAAHRNVASARDGTRGYILSRAVEKNGRPVSFVFAGDPAEQDGADVRLDVVRLRDSFNFVALAEGQAYPTFYEGLFRDLRDALTTASADARSDRRGIWDIDRTNDGFDVRALADITDRHAILPKLFRRLSVYMVGTGTAQGFKAELEKSREPVLDLRDNNFTHLDTFVEEASGAGGIVNIRMTRQPEELVFDPMPARPVNAFVAQVGGETEAGSEAFPLSNELVARLAEALRTVDAAGAA
jgi:endonuclease YncB( thermonuclease family)